MSDGELLSIQPDELRFPFELKKQISCSIQLANQTEHYVAFKVKTTNPKKYCVRPNSGVVQPRATFNVVVTMQAQREAPQDMQCKDKFLFQSVIAAPGATQNDVKPEMFDKEPGNHVEECKLRVAYVSPPQPPSPVVEVSDEGSSPRTSFSENRSAMGFESVSLENIDFKDKSLEARAVVSRLTEKKNSVIQLNNKLQQELEILRKQANRAQSGYPFLYVAIVGLLGILIGYLMRS